MMDTVSLNKGQYTGEIVEIQYLNGLTVGSTSYSAEAHISPLHYHQNPHVSFLLKGGHVEKRTKGLFERLPGDILFCHGGEPHQFITQKFPSKNVNLELDYEFLKENNISEANLNEAVTKNPDAKFLMLKMYKELIFNDNFSETTIQILLLGLINSADALANQNKPKWVSVLFEVLNDRWSEQLTLNEISKLLYVHPVTISKYFSKYFACTFGEYMRKLKINKSIGLIRNQNKPLTDIAFECGFADQSHFIRTFKEITGWLPKKFQKL